MMFTTIKCLQNMSFYLINSVIALRIEHQALSHGLRESKHAHVFDCACVAISSSTETHFTFSELHQTSFHHAMMIPPLWEKKKTVTF